MSALSVLSEFSLHPTGWSIEGLLDWGPFVKLAIPGMLMFCIDWWSFEVGSFLMGKYLKSHLIRQL